MIIISPTTNKNEDIFIQDLDIYITLQRIIFISWSLSFKSVFMISD